MIDMINEQAGWLFVAYLTGSIATYLLMLKATYIDASSKTIDTLAENGFLRTRTNEDGEIEILKWDAPADE